MTSRIPEPASDAEAEGIPDSQDVEPEQAATGDAEDTGNTVAIRQETPLAVDEFGTTAEEEREGEPLDGRLEREEPEVLADVGQAADESERADTPYNEESGQGVGRLVEPDEGARADTEAEMVADDVGTDLGGYSAEESAMHVAPEA